MSKRTEHQEFVAAAIVGYRYQRDQLNHKIAELELEIGERAPSGGEVVAIHRKHQISPEGRERIAAAQRARWAKKKKAEQRQQRKMA